MIPASMVRHSALFHEHVLNNFIYLQYFIQPDNRTLILLTVSTPRHYLLIAPETNNHLFSLTKTKPALYLIRYFLSS
jgi:hypothetical protein